MDSNVPQVIRLIEDYYGSELITPHRFGAKGDGVTDDTAAIQAALDSGSRMVYFPTPPVAYLASSLLMPNVLQFVALGDGPSSIFKQKAGAAGALFRWATAGNVYNEQTVRDIAIIGTNGTQHCIDATGAGGLTLDGIYIVDVPVGKSGIFMNGAAGSQSHDQRANNIQIYSNTAGHSGIRLGPLNADAQISRFIMNGNLVVDYCMHVDAGAIATTVLDSHPYNAKINVLKLAGANNYFSFTECTLDNAITDLVDIASSDLVTFTTCYFEAIKATYSGVNITGTSNGVSHVNCKWQGAANSASCIKAEATTQSIVALGGTVSTISNFVTPFDLAGASSWAKAIGGWNPYGIDHFCSGCQTSAQAQNTAQYLGVNSSNASENAVEYVIPYDSKCTSISISLSATPPGGQTMTFTARKNGVDVGTPLVISNGVFGGTINDAGSFGANSRFTISSVFSVTSGSSIVRFSAKFTA